MIIFMAQDILASSTVNWDTYFFAVFTTTLSSIYILHWSPYRRYNCSWKVGAAKVLRNNGVSHCICSNVPDNDCPTFRQEYFTQSQPETFKKLELSQEAL